MSELHGIHDLRPLLPPADDGDGWWVAIALSATMLVLALLGWWSRSRGTSPGWFPDPRWRAQWRLLRLQQDPAAVLDSARSARQLARILADGLGLVHIGPRTRLPATLSAQQPRWERFVGRLSAACYGGREHGGGVAELSAEARYWLRQWR